MELIFEIVFEIYIELMMYIVPDEKASSKKYRMITILIATSVLLGFFALFIWGCILITDYDSKFGLVLILISVIISIIQIIAGVILHNKHSKK